MKPTMIFFITWSIVVFISIFLQIYIKYNVGILFVLLMIPMFIHDILLLFFKKLQGGEIK